MTVSNDVVLVHQNGNGAANQFTFSGKVFLATDLVVKTRVIATGTVTTQVKDGAGTYDYTVALQSDFDAGTVTLNTILPVTHEITIERVSVHTQGVSFPENNPFPTATVEQILDKLTLQIQEVFDLSSRALKFDAIANDIGNVTFPDTVTLRQNKVLAFDSAGDISVTQELGVFKGDWAVSTLYNPRDIIKDTSNGNIYIANTVHTSSGTQPISGNADFAKWDLLVDALSATTSASNAAISATVSTNSATNAATSESNASTSANNASVSETNALSSKNAAAISAAAALVSETNSAASANAAALNAGIFSGTTTGSANSYVFDPSPALGSYSLGNLILIKIHAGNTLGSTVNVSGLGVKTILTPDGSALIEGDLPVNGMALLSYDGTNFKLLTVLFKNSAIITSVRQNLVQTFANSLRISILDSSTRLSLEDGFEDPFNDFTGVDETLSSGHSEDAVNKLIENIDGGVGLNFDFDFSVESDYLQKEFTNANQSTSQATFTNASATVTISSGTWPTNALNMRISPDAGVTWFDIKTRVSGTSLTLNSNFTGTTGAKDYIIRPTEFVSGKAQFNEISFPEHVDDADTLLLLNMNGADASTTFTDIATPAHTMTAGGNAQIDTAQSVFGGASGLFDGAGDYVSTPDAADWDITGDFTIDLRARWSVVGDQGLVTHQTTGGVGWSFYYDSTGSRMAFSISDAPASVSFSWTPSANTWYHLALVRTGTTYKFFVDGVQTGGDQIDATALQASTELLVIGMRQGTTFQPFNGWLDDVRISTVARWTSNFSSSTVNVINESVCVMPLFSALKFSTNVTSIKSGTVTETGAGGGSYALVLVPAGATQYDENTLVISLQPGGDWKRCVWFNPATGKWERNTDHTTSSAETWVTMTGTDATDIVHAIAKAIGSNSFLGMLKADLEALSSSTDRTPTLTSDTTPAPNIASASSEFSTSRQAWNAFTTSGISWATASGSTGWVALDLGAGNGIVVNSFQMKALAGEETRAPKDFTLDGWDGSAWATIQSFAGIGPWGSNEIKTFNTQSNVTSYEKHRINVTLNNGDALLQFTGLRFFADDFKSAGGFIPGTHTKFGFAYRNFTGSSTNNKGVDLFRVVVDADNAPMSLRFDPFTTVGTNKFLYFLLQAEELTGTPTVEISRDNFTNFTTAAMTLVVSNTSGINIYDSFTDLSSLPAGTSINARIITAQADKIKVHGVGLFGRSV